MRLAACQRTAGCRAMLYLLGLLLAAAIAELFDIG